MAQSREFHLPDDLYYDRKDHLWARVEEGLVRVGLDQLGACAAGTFAYVKLMPVGREVKKGRAFGSVEAGKYVGPLKAPVAGKIGQVNQEVLDDPRILNRDHYDRGWFVVIEPSNLELDLVDLVQGAEIQTWLDSDLAQYEEKGLLKPQEERQCA